MIKSVAIFTILLLSCVASSTSAFSQPNQYSLDLPGNKLILGIRTIASPVTQFCQAFRNTLEKSLKGQGIEITAPGIGNQYKGDFYSRYGGLLENPSSDKRIDIECGPNSKASGELLNPKSSEPFSKDIAFSNHFHTTGIRLLLRKDLAQRLSSPSNSLETELRNLKIGVLSGTTTQKQLQDDYRKKFYTVIPIEPINEDPSDKTKGTNSLERALKSLETKDIDALASDALIVQTFLKEGVQGEGDQTKDIGKMIFVRKRPPYQNQEPGFGVFPSEELISPDKNKSQYLPNTDKELYAMAVRSGTPNTDALRKLIDDALSDLDKPGTELRLAQSNLIAKDSLTDRKPENSVNPTIPIIVPPGPNNGSNNNDDWWKSPTIIAALITGAAAVIVAMINPQFIGGTFHFIGAIISPFIALVTQMGKSSSRSRTITGRILNANTGAWIGGARVTLEADGTPPPVEYTDSEGIFEFLLQSSTDRVRIRVDANGFETFDRRINLTNPRGVVEDIRLSPRS